MIKNRDPLLQVGSRSPLIGQRNTPKVSPKIAKANEKAEILATAKSVIKHEISRITTTLEKTRHIDNFTKHLPMLPTDTEEYSLAAKLEARQSIIQFLEAELKHYELLLKEVTNG